MGLDEVTDLGAIAGSKQAQRWGELADRNRPILHTHDRCGNRIDEVEYDPAYHELMRTAIRHGLHAAPWADPRPARTWFAPPRPACGPSNPATCARFR
ncbi:acyl-CoA dehydrogenase domain protein [Mycobacterium xenopi 3993]|nr:acyl-CoA dehydrogenase domain protein [Mycobacterium xenopi 3993]